MARRIGAQSVEVAGIRGALIDNLERSLDRPSVLTLMSMTSAWSVNALPGWWRICALAATFACRGGRSRVNCGRPAARCSD
jgi:hypothetical protein